MRKRKKKDMKKSNIQYYVQLGDYLWEWSIISWKTSWDQWNYAELSILGEALWENKCQRSLCFSWTTNEMSFKISLIIISVVEHQNVIHKLRLFWMHRSGYKSVWYFSSEYGKLCVCNKENNSTLYFVYHEYIMFSWRNEFSQKFNQFSLLHHQETLLLESWISYICLVLFYSSF